MSEFGRRSFRDVTMNDIAALAGCTKPTLYAHFAGKDALLDAALEREAARCRQWLFERYEAAASLPMKAEIVSGVHALFDYVAAHPDGFQLMFGPHSAGQADAVRASLLADITDQVAWRLHHHNQPGRGSPGRTEQQIAASVVSVAFTGVQFAHRTRTAVDRARDTATDFTVAAITTMSKRPMRERLDARR